MSITATIKKDWTKLEGFVRTLELKFFGGKLHQKATHPMTNESAWVEVESHEEEAEKPAEAAGEPVNVTGAPGAVVPPGEEQGSVSGTPQPGGPDVHVSTST